MRLVRRTLLCLVVGVTAFGAAGWGLRPRKQSTLHDKALPAQGAAREKPVHPSGTPAVVRLLDVRVSVGTASDPNAVVLIPTFQYEGPTDTEVDLSSVALIIDLLFIPARQAVLVAPEPDPPNTRTISCRWIIPKWRNLMPFHPITVAFETGTKKPGSEEVVNAFAAVVLGDQLPADLRLVQTGERFVPLTIGANVPVHSWDGPPPELEPYLTVFPAARLNSTEVNGAQPSQLSNDTTSWASALAIAALCMAGTWWLCAWRYRRRMRFASVGAA